MDMSKIDDFILRKLTPVTDVIEQVTGKFAVYSMIFLPFYLIWQYFIR
jgi:hypothetical protein